LSGSDTLADYRAVLSFVTFSSTSSDPTDNGADPSRTIILSVNDGASTNSTPATSTVNVLAFPTVVAGSAATYHGGGAVVLLDSGLALSDTSSATLASATISISSGFIGGDTLNFTNQNGITSSYNSSNGVLTLSGTTSLVNYQMALESITYGFTPTFGDPTGGGSDTTRTISWVVNDGTNSSALATSSVDLSAPNVPSDFTGDGTSDVLLQNGGTVVDWLMQNGLYSSGNVLTSGATG
jgi:hypothetical protein